MTDYLLDYGIESTDSLFADKSIELNKEHYQLIKVAHTFFYIDKQSDVVIRLEPFKNSRGTAIISVMKKNKHICHYRHHIEEGLAHKYNYNRFLEVLVFLAQTSFYFLLEDISRQEVVDFLSMNDDCRLRIQTIDNSVVDRPHHEFVSMDICNDHPYKSQNIDFHVVVKPEISDRLIMRNLAIFSDFYVDRVKKLYQVKQTIHYHSINKEFHHYELVIRGDYNAELKINYDKKKAKTIFSLHTYPHGEPAVKTKQVSVPHDNNFQVSIFKMVGELFLHKYPSTELVAYFDDLHMDVSNGLEKDHLTLLDMVEI